MLHDPSDRGEDGWRKSVKKRCLELGYPCSGQSPNSPETVAQVQQIAPQLLLSVQLRALLKAPILAAAQRTVNVHNAPLPLLRPQGRQGGCRAVSRPLSAALLLGVPCLCAKNLFAIENDVS